MSAPVLDSVKAVENKLEETKTQDLNAQDSKSKDDNAEKNDAPNLESTDRFEPYNVLSTLIGVVYGTTRYNRRTNTKGKW